MCRTAVVCVSVLLLAVSAGCSGVLPVDKGAKSARDPYEVPLTETDLPTRTSTGTPGTVEFVPDDFSLTSVVVGHTNGLEGKSFSVEHTEVVRNKNGTVLRKDRIRARLAANRTRFAISRGQWQLGNTWGYDRFWSPGGRAPVLHAIERDGPTEYVAYTAADEDPIQVTDIVSSGGRFRNRLFQIASIVEDATVTPPKATQSNLYVITGTEFTDQWLINRGENGTVSNVSLILTVRRMGVIDQLELEYDLTVDDRTVRVVESYRFRLVAETDVATPNWANVSMSSVKTKRVDGSRDSVGLPMVSGGGTSFDDESDNETNPYPPRSLTDASGTVVPSSRSNEGTRSDSAMARSRTSASG